jgi:PKD domain-containing protein
MGPARLLLLAGLLVLAFALPSRPVDIVHAQSQSTSIIRIDPAGSCCVVRGSSFTVNVVLDLVPGEIIQGFDVRINYSNPYTNANPGGIQAKSLNYAGNIFGSSGSVGIDCINGLEQQGGNGCGDDSLGQIHLQEVVVGKAATSGGRLFSIAFLVGGSDPSVFTFDRANLINPNGDPSNPQLIDPVFIPVIKQDAVFGNTGVVAFFNYQPHDTSLSPAIIPNALIDFNGSISFVGNDTSIGIKSYSWDFGNVCTAVSTVLGHCTFPQPGNYTVSLTVVDDRNETGSISRRVSVVPALGSIDLMVKDQLGNVLADQVTVRIYNSTLSTRPFATNTTSTEAVFKGLSPSSSYYLSFSGAAVENFSKTEIVRPGLTTQDSVYLTLKPPPADYSGLIYAGSLVAALGVVGGAIVYQKRSSKNKSSSRANKKTNTHVSR